MPELPSKKPSSSSYESRVWLKPGVAVRQTNELFVDNPHDAFKRMVFQNIAGILAHDLPVSIQRVNHVQEGNITIAPRTPRTTRFASAVKWREAQRMGDKARAARLKPKEREQLAWWEKKFPAIHLITVILRDRGVELNDNHFNLDELPDGRLHAYEVNSIHPARIRTAVETLDADRKKQVLDLLDQLEHKPEALRKQPDGWLY